MTESSKNVTKHRRRRGSAWYWKQTDCWYYTPRGSKRRAPLVDAAGRRIRGADARQEAQLALARIRLKQGLSPGLDASVTTTDAAWTVARVCSDC